MVQTTHTCEVCGSRHKNLTDAIQCERRPMRGFDNIKTGDIVLCGYPLFGWWDGSPDWRSEWRDDGSRFLTGYKPRWLVVAVYPDGRSHKNRYALYTPSYSNGESRIAWTSVDHVTPEYERSCDTDEIQAIAGNDFVRRHLDAPSKIELM